jgi:hypothetical protein
MSRRAPRVSLALALLLCGTGAAFGQSPGRSPIRSTPHFAFYSDFETNLNDALIAAGVARKAAKPEIFRTGPELACFDKLAQAARAGWNGAVTYYSDVVSPASFGDRRQYLLRAQLAGFDDDLKNPADREYADIARSFRAAAAPAFRACRWTAQDEKNRRWISDLQPLLDAHEQKIASRLERLYGREWKPLPIPVDVVETVDWSGANSVLRGPMTGHLLVSNTYRGFDALEVVFHEASHLLMGRGAPVQQALEKAASDAGYRLPGELWHIVLFYTTGEVVRSTLEQAGNPGYKMMVFAIFERSAWPGYREPLETAWRPYVEGKRSLSEAAAALIEAVRRAKEPAK